MLSVIFALMNPYGFKMLLHSAAEDFLPFQRIYMGLHVFQILGFVPDLCPAGEDFIIRLCLFYFSDFWGWGFLGGFVGGFVALFFFFFFCIDSNIAAIAASRIPKLKPWSRKDYIKEKQDL